ncbi:hypothetical protein MNBD_GAMMA09-2511 [hydrothermal vent metagenome]|uniref:Uncharacterized protein n=1 Tax=hydrothermal vent metagenome TaxID=652676 RepID=A0A3B0Y5V9_9ZZZZ
MSADSMLNTGKKLRIFYITSIFSIAFAMLGFSYNAWRMEVTEDNSNIRTAAFEVLLQLSELQQIIYSAHYDKNSDEGNPRKAWVKIGLIADLSTLISPKVEADAVVLNTLWSENWQLVTDDEKFVQQLISQIDKVRTDINVVLKNLQ